nr:hypothetical protein [Tanacetum cinerariifolium]
MANLPADHNGFAPAAEAAPDNMNEWESKLPPPPAESDTSSDTEPEVETEDEDENKAATFGTINRVPYHVQLFSGTTYVGSGSSRKVFSPDPLGKDVDILHRKVKSLAQQMFERSETREHYELKQSVSTLEDKMRGLMLEDKEEKERLKKKLKVSQEEKEQMEQDFRHVVDCIRKHFGVIMPPKAMSQAAIERLITQRVNVALEVERACQANVGAKKQC